MAWDISDRQVAHWKMNDNDASTDVVESISSYNGTAPDTTDNMTVNGRINSALYLTRANSEFITIPYTPFVVGTGDFAMAVWVKSDNSGQYGGVCGNRGSGDPECSINFYPGGTVEYYIVYEYWVSNDSICDGNWHWVVMMRTSNIMYLAINNVEQNNSGNESWGDITPSWSEFFIGTYWAGGGDGHLLNGAVDDLRFFNGALTSTELDGLWNSGSGTEADSGGATGWTHKINAVPNANIGKVDNVAKANIAKVIGV